MFAGKSLYNHVSISSKHHQEAEKVLENNIKCDNFVNRGQRVLKLPYAIYRRFLVKAQKYSDVHNYVISRLLKMTFIIKLMT